MLAIRGAQLFHCLFGYAPRYRKGRRPLEVTSAPASGSEHLFDPFAHFLMCNELTPIKLIQPFSHLLPEPRIVVHVTLDKLLDVFYRAAIILGGDSIEFGL
jgi:hypothetical protein